MTAMERAHRLWGGRFAGQSAAALEALNRSIGIDFRLWPFDIRLSKAWAVGLWQAGVLTLDESRRMEVGLDAVAVRYPRLKSYLLDDQGRVRKHVAIFVDGALCPRDTVLARALTPRSDVFVFQALSGG